MWEEREYEIFDEVEEYNPEYDNTDCFSYLELDSSDSFINNENEENFEYDDDCDFDYQEQ